MTTAPSLPTPFTPADAATDAARIADLQTLGQAAEWFARKAKAANTRKAYTADWDDFGHWCQRFGRIALPANPDTVALYLADCSVRLKASTL